jgi:hypothetical protein
VWPAARRDFRNLGAGRAKTETFNPIRRHSAWRSIPTPAATAKIFLCALDSDPADVAGSSPMRDLTEFLERLARLAPGYTEGTYAGGRWSVSLKRSADERSVSLLARELGGRGLVSFNLYATSAGAQLRPCEMPEAAVVEFVLGFEADH